MSTPTVTLIDITSDLSAHPTSADHESQFTGTRRGATSGGQRTKASRRRRRRRRTVSGRRAAADRSARNRAPRRIIALRAGDGGGGMFGVPVANSLSAGGFEDPTRNRRGRRSCWPTSSTRATRSC